ncbi:MAG: type II toxin-antitoxin system VapC family toxin [Dehalococcoidia bacterium]
MSDAIVVDASIALKWIFNEDYSDGARSLLRHTLAQGHELVAPAIFLSEVTNAVFQHERLGLITAKESDLAIASLLANPVEVLSPPTLYGDALELARQHGLRATYDSQYLALAVSLDAEFWTADDRLFDALPRSLGWVRRIADYRVPRALRKTSLLLK